MSALGTKIQRLYRLVEDKPQAKKALDEVVDDLSKELGILSDMIGGLR